ncbi:unnamed protein product [Darwinula stevensoni]|uniref:Mediator of RNA polymerase II transcription subunit 19 n=1 Tax=Darwinula stevensoni TaxID=69355 RepID=A0A7R9A479_9CRUS|nr:unnamed protein product [Darwinula stevensoni]CAG0891998.1 unnamed protein product [Darwinula stevensoni]
MMMDPMQASPKSSLSSPRGNRSPVVPRQDSTGTLKTTIALGKTGPSIVHTGPFYLMKELPCPSELTGATNLMAFHDLEHSYNKFSGKKVKDQLSCFLPNLPGSIDSPGRDQDNSTLRSVIEKPPIVGKELHPLSQAQLAGFRLYPGPLPEQYRFMNQSPSKKKHKQKKHKHKGAGEPGSTEGGEGEIHEKKKKRKHDDDRRKKKKEKKKKKQKHSPEHVGAIGPTQ